MVVETRIFRRATITFMVVNQEHWQENADICTIVHALYLEGFRMLKEISSKAPFSTTLQLLLISLSRTTKVQVYDGIYCNVIAVAAKNFTVSIKTRVIDIKIVHMRGRRAARQKKAPTHIAELRFVMYFSCSNIDSYMTQVREKERFLAKKSMKPTEKVISACLDASEHFKRGNERNRIKSVFGGVYFSAVLSSYSPPHT